MKPISLLLATGMIGALATAQAQQSTDPAPPPPAETSPAIGITAEQLAAIQKQLLEIEKAIESNRGDLFGSAYAKFKTAVESPKSTLSLFLDCYKLNHYERRDLKSIDFNEWRKNNSDRFDSDEVLEALHLQLEYLIISMSVQNSKKIEELSPQIAQLESFIPRAVNAVEKTFKRNASGTVEARIPGQGGNNRQGQGADQFKLQTILSRSVKNSEFAEAYQLGEHLKKSDWEYVPLDIEKIYGKVIFPYYLATKKEELPAQWNKRIEAELNLRRATMSDSEFEQYTRERTPEFQWEKATFMLDNKIKTTIAVADMLRVVKENTSHPKAQEWLTDLRTRLSRAQAASKAQVTE